MAPQSRLLVDCLDSLGAKNHNHNKNWKCSSKTSIGDFGPHDSRKPIQMVDYMVPLPPHPPIG